MSVSIKNNAIRLTRGDTLIAALSIKDTDGHDYTPETGDLLRFAVKKHYRDTETVILKEIDTDEPVVRIDPADTEDLEFGEYVYDIQLTYASGAVDTFIAEGRLEILPEVE